MSLSVPTNAICIRVGSRFAPAPMLENTLIPSL
jgi:hypothetical protein